MSINSKRNIFLRRVLVFLMTLSLTAGLTGPAAPVTVQGAAKVTITVTAVNTGKLTIPVKTSYKLQAKASSGKLKYKSSRPKVVSVTSKGVVKGMKAGKAVITITGKNKTKKKINVTVVAKSKYKGVRKVKFSGTKTTMTAGETQKLKVVFTPKKPSNKNLKFKSSNKNIATVTANGKVTAKKTGTVKITVTSSADKKVKKSIKIKVDKAPYVVTFDSQGGSAVAPQSVKEGQKAKKPVDPTLSGAIFAGWYLDGEAEPFDFSTPIKSNITLHADWEFSSVKNDGKVDAGDLAAMEAAGKIEVKKGEDSAAPKAIIGKFTEEKVTDEAGVKKVLNSMESLFNQGITDDGKSEERNFDVDLGEIDTEKLAAVKDDNGKTAAAEALYRYTPKMKAGDHGNVPVEGADIILSTDGSGNVTGMNTTYDNAFTTLTFDAGKDITERMATNIALSYVRAAAIPKGTQVGGLTSSGELIVFTDTKAADDFVNNTGVTNPATAEEKGKPFYAYKISVMNAEFGSNAERETDEPDASGEERPEASDLGVSFSVPRISWTVYVDAMTGKVRLAFSNLEEANWTDTTVTMAAGSNQRRNVNVMTTLYTGNRYYRLVDRTRNLQLFRVRQAQGPDAGGKYTYTEEDFATKKYIDIRFNGSPPVTGFPAAARLMSNAARAYDYYLKYMGRKGTDGEGGRLYIGYQSSNKDGANAYTKGNENMIYFTTPSTEKDYTLGLDVLAHEFTHSVINHVVPYSLMYSGETGALNEAYADILSEIIEGDLNRDSTDSWRHGEDCGLNGHDGTNRNLADPKSHNQPNHYDDYVETSSDNGGVHTNSGIFSHAFYKMATSTEGRKISFARWGNLYYRSLFRLTHKSTFTDARYAILTEAEIMGFTKVQRKAIADAYDAVGIKEPEKITMTLTWGANPKDLDLYMIGPWMGSYYYVNCNGGNKIFSDNGKLVASLDQDARSGYGKEVITLHKLYYGDYYVVVCNSSVTENEKDTTLAKSQATVKVVTSDGSYTYHIDSGSKGTHWLAYKITIDNNKVALYKMPYDYYSKKRKNTLYKYGTSSLLSLIEKQYK